MSITFNCQNCGKPNKHPAESGGSYVACNHCAMRQQVPMPNKVESYAPRRKREMHIRFSTSRIILVVAILAAVVVIYSRSSGGPEPLPKHDDVQAAVGQNELAPRVAEREGFGERRAPVREPSVRPAPQKTASAEIKSEGTPTSEAPKVFKPKGKDDAEVRRSLERARTAKPIEGLNKSEPVKKADAPKTDWSKVPAKSEKKETAPVETKKRMTVAQCRSAIDRAKVLLESQRWDAAAKILVEVSADGPTRESAEARVLMRKVPPEFRPKN